jgi:hypothetical protein
MTVTTHGARHPFSKKSPEDAYLARFLRIAASSFLT